MVTPLEQRNANRPSAAVALVPAKAEKFYKELAEKMLKHASSKIQKI